jgi:cytosine permease
MDDEYQNEPVPDHACLPWWRIGLTNAVFSLSLPTFVSGIELMKAAPVSTVISATLAAGLFLTLLASAMSVIGTNTRLSSYMLARIAFGDRAAILLNLAFALSLLGWFGLNIELFGEAVQPLLRDRLGLDVPMMLCEAVGAAAMTGLTLAGMRAMSGLSILVAPLMMVATALMLNKVLAAQSLASIMARGVPAGMSFGEIVSASVGVVVVGVVIMPDTCRFVRTGAGGIGVAVITYLITSPMVVLAAGLAGLASGNTDILALMLALGLGIWAFAIVIGGSTSLNALNLYSAVLSVRTAFPALTRPVVVIAGGVGGLLFAFLGILDSFIPFLTWLTVIFIPVGVIIMLDFHLLRRAAWRTGDLLQALPALRPAALLAWAIGSGVASLTMAGVFSVSGTVAFDALMVTMPAYALCLRLLPDAATVPS